MGENARHFGQSREATPKQILLPGLAQELACQRQHRFDVVGPVEDEVSYGGVVEVGSHGLE